VWAIRADGSEQQELIAEIDERFVIPSDWRSSLPA
jgi:hypothetical protein